MAVHCKIKNVNPRYSFEKSRILFPIKETIKKHTAENPTRDENPSPETDFKATRELDKAQKATFSHNLPPISATRPATGTTECINHRCKYQAEIAMFSLESILEVPHINLDGGLMACWSDVKEILFPGCSGPGCKIVLRSLEMKLNYPPLTKDIRNCSASERSRFINGFHCVEQGETIVNLRFVKRHWESLVETVVEKHRVSTDAASANCFCKTTNDGYGYGYGGKRLDILCDVGCTAGSHCYRSTNFSIEFLSTQSGDEVVHPVPGFVMRGQRGSKEMYIPLVTLTSTYRNLSSRLRAFLRQLVERSAWIPGSKRMLNKPLIAFCSERQGQILSHLMNRHACSGPHITSRTMLVKWSYLTKSYFAWNLLTKYLQLVHKYNENPQNCSTPSPPKSNNLHGDYPELLDPNEEEPIWPLRPLQNYQERLWDYQKMKHQFCKKVNHQLASRDKFQAHGQPLTSGAVVINKPTESGKLSMKKKWLSSLGKYGDKEVIRLQKTDQTVIINQSKSPLTERRKVKAYRHNSEKENNATVLTTSNPRIHHSGQEKANFKDLTSQKGQRRSKEKVRSSHPCYRDRDKDKSQDTRERSRPSPREIHNVKSNSSQPRNITAGECRRASSENIKKADCDKTFEKREAGKIGNKDSNHHGRPSHHKKERARQEHKSDYTTPHRTPGEQRTKHNANSTKAVISFGGKEEGGSLGTEQATVIGVPGKKCDRVLNKETKHADKGDNQGSRQGSQADNKGVEFIQQLKPSENTNNKVIATHNNRNTKNNYYNINNNADEYPESGKDGIIKTKDNSTRKTPSINSISTNSQKSKNMNKKKQEVGIGCDNKKKIKMKYKRRKITLERRYPLRISRGPKPVSTARERAANRQANKNQRGATQASRRLKVNPRPGRPRVARNSESEVGDEAVAVTARRSLTTQSGCKENPQPFEYIVCKSAQSKTVKLLPRNTVGQESTEKDKGSSEETRNLVCKLHDPCDESLESCSPQKQLEKCHCSICLNQSATQEQAKQNSSNQAYASTSDAEIHSSMSLPLIGTPTPSPEPLTSGENGTSPKHPKKTLLDNFRREVQEALEVDQNPIRVQALHDAVPRGDTFLSLEKIPNERRTFKLKLRLTPDSCSQQYTADNESVSEFPFSFRLECLYDAESKRVGYIHRRFPAISVPYIMIGEDEFITVRSALKLFSRFDESCYVQYFLRDDKQASCRTTCNQAQASLLRRINTMPDLKPTQGEELVQIGPLIFKFHRFKDVMRRLQFLKSSTEANSIVPDINDLMP